MRCHADELEMNPSNSIKVRLMEWSYQLQANDIIVVDVSGILEYKYMSNAQIYHSHVAYYSDSCDSYYSDI